MAIELKENERLDDLQRNGLQIIQKTDGFCFGMDAVLLSGFAAVKPGERALDLGTGTGIIPLLLSAKTEGEHFSALEIQDEIALIASAGTPAAPGAGAIILFTILSGLGYINDGALLAYSLILAINRPIEMLVTALNVVGDSATAIYVAKSEGMLNEDIYNS